jgi:tRNA modification GTPase
VKEESTICAISTPPGTGAISIIRLSGINALSIANNIFQIQNNQKQVSQLKPNTVHYGSILFQDQIIDQALLTIFKAPKSYTGEDIVEISCHGSIYIQQRIMEILIASGARNAEPGEFTLRAFLNGKMDLSQSEAVADLISSRSKSLHQAAIKQMRGGFSSEISILREKLLEFTSLVELELDFGEEDVNFADRQELKEQIEKIQTIIYQLLESFKYGNVLKNGVSVAIVGKPNVGKSTLLNILLNDEKAIVSEIPGTTRDIIEDTINIQGILFRFIDTAGIRESADKLELLGIERTYANIKKASIILFIAEANDTIQEIAQQLENLYLKDEQKLIVIINKIDLVKNEVLINSFKSLKINDKYPVISISAKRKLHIDNIIQLLIESVKYKEQLFNDIIVINLRHYESLKGAYNAGIRVLNGLKNSIYGDLLAQNIREMIYHLGAITGEITTDEVLGNIFKNFCIGK